MNFECYDRDTLIEQDRKGLQGSLKSQMVGQANKNKEIDDDFCNSSWSSIYQKAFQARHQFPNSKMSWPVAAVNTNSSVTLRTINTAESWLIVSSNDEINTSRRSISSYAMKIIEIAWSNEPTSRRRY